MNALQTRALAFQLEVNLEPNNGKLRATPVRHITPELRTGLAANREEILRDLLIKEAYRFLARHNRTGAELSALAPESFDRVNETYADGSYEEFLEALREWTEEARAALSGARPRKDAA